MDVVYNFKGLAAPPVVPLNKDGSVNYEVIPKYVDHLVEHGVKGVFVNGTQGEWSSLTVDERRKIAEEWIKHGRQKLDLIIVHAGSHCLADAKILAAHAESIGADAIAVIAPNFLRAPDEETLTDFLKEAADSAPNTPFLYYHLPWLTDIEVEWSKFLQLCTEKIPKFCGMKYTSRKCYDGANALHFKPRKLKVFSGDDFQLLGALTMGIDAAVGSTYNFTGKQMNEMLKAFYANNIEKARGIQLKCASLDPFFRKYGGISCGKALTHIVSGIDVGQPRLPLKAISKEAFEEMKKHMAENGYEVKV